MATSRVDRVALVRQMLEDETLEKEILSPELVTNTPWDQAVKRQARTTEEAQRLTFDVDDFLSDVRINVLEAVEEGDKVVVRWRLRGTWTKPFLRTKPTGQEIDITGINIYRFVGDKIVEKTGEFDAATLTAQAGLAAEECQEAMTALARPTEVLEPALRGRR